MYLRKPFYPATSSPLKPLLIGRDAQSPQRERLCADPWYAGDQERHGHRCSHPRAGEEGQIVLLSSYTHSAADTISY